MDQYTELLLKDSWSENLKNYTISQMCNTIVPRPVSGQTRRA